MTALGAQSQAHGDFCFSFREMKEHDGIHSNHTQRERNQGEDGDEAGAIGSAGIRFPTGQSSANDAIRIDKATGVSQDRAYAENKTNQAGKRSA
jgi:hypothetical protein